MTDDTSDETALTHKTKKCRYNKHSTPSLFLLSSCSCYFFVFRCLYFRRENIRKTQKKKEAAAVAAEANKDTCGVKVASEELAAINLVVIETM